MKDLVERLIKLNKTISTMESCTGGGVANEITNIEGASKVLKFSAVTYCNEFKIKMNVDKNVIDRYSVYSIETACEMAKKISLFTNSDYAVGITGKLNRVDNNNLYGKDNIVFISIYELILAIDDYIKYYNYDLEVSKENRKENKELVINKVVKELLNILK